MDIVAAYLLNTSVWIVFQFTAIFVALHLVFQRKMGTPLRMEVEMPSKTVIKSIQTGSKSEQRLRRSSIFLTLSFYLSWLLLLIVILLSPKEKNILLVSVLNSYCIRIIIYVRD